jgi:hypothetical protein
MSDEIELPRRLTVLGEAMRPLWITVRSQIDRPVHQALADAPSMVDVVSHHLGVLQNTILRLTDRINSLMTDVVSNDDVSDPEVYRAVGGFEAFLDDLLASYHAVRVLNVYGDDAEARDLLACVYRHSLVEVRDWLQELVETLANPLDALRKRGLPTSGAVELPLTLTLTSAPELAGLSQWAELHSLDYSRSRPKHCAGLGFWGTVGAMAIGFGIGDALFGDDD